MLSRSSSPAGRAVPPSIWEVLNVAPRGAALYQALDAGFPAEVFPKLGEAAGLSRERLGRALDIAPATLQRRAKSGRFTRDESDRLFRLIKLLNLATDLFEGDADAAREWINHPVKGLGERRPVDMLATSAEADEVFNLIGRLEHGVFA